MYNLFDPKKIQLTKYLFFTGKGGVGKTSTACATAMTLADEGKRVMLISTDPASNLQDVFGMELSNRGTSIPEVPNLVVANLDPIQAAEEYKESVIAPYRGKLPDSVIANMAEQLSGSCTVEIAAFNEFSNFIADETIRNNYDHIIFDTAPTGHTLRMLQLPSAWSNFISENTHGASCLGQLSGLEDKKEIYQKAVKTLSNSEETTVILVSRPEATPLKEAQRASQELIEIGVCNQILIINGLLMEWDDQVSKRLFEKQQLALKELPAGLKHMVIYGIPLRGYNITGLDRVRAFLTQDQMPLDHVELSVQKLPKLQNIVEDLYRSHKRVIFTMGKGGVGKTTIAAAIALGLAKKGLKVHLTTTDPAGHLNFIINSSSTITLSHIDEAVELRKYRDEVLAKARETMSEEALAYVEEDLRSPCTQEIAVFRAFAEIVEAADDQVVVIDTAPTGHTLLLLDSTQSYHREIQRSQGDIPLSVKKLLPRISNRDETEVIIVTLPETTPVFEAMRLEDDLKRAGIYSKWWIINGSLYGAGSTNTVLRARANNEIPWINWVAHRTNGSFGLVGWTPEEVKGEQLYRLLEP